MIKYILKKSSRNDSTLNKWYAYPVIEETINLRQLAKHMSQHNSGFSEAQCLGVMTAMVVCIKEQILDGKNVKIDDLAIFSCGIRNKGGAASQADFTTDNISTVKFRARATGLLSNKKLDLEATLKRASAVTNA
jgi:predicted histone-like DNA-binding protein